MPKTVAEYEVEYKKYRRQGWNDYEAMNFIQREMRGEVDDQRVISRDIVEKGLYLTQHPETFDEMQFHGEWCVDPSAMVRHAADYLGDAAMEQYVKQQTGHLVAVDQKARHPGTFQSASQHMESFAKNGATLKKAINQAVNDAGSEDQFKRSGALGFLAGLFPSKK